MRTWLKTSVIRFHLRVKPLLPTTVKSCYKHSTAVQAVWVEPFLHIQRTLQSKTQISSSSLQPSIPGTFSKYSKWMIKKIQQNDKSFIHICVVSLIRSKAYSEKCFEYQRRIDATRQDRSVWLQFGSGTAKWSRRCSLMVRRQLCTSSLSRLLRRIYSLT